MVSGGGRAGGAEVQGVVRRRRRCRGAEAEEGVLLGAGVGGGNVCGCKGTGSEERVLRRWLRGAEGEKVPVGARRRVGSVRG